MDGPRAEAQCVNSVADGEMDGPLPSRTMDGAARVRGCEEMALFHKGAVLPLRLAVILAPPHDGDPRSL